MNFPHQGTAKYVELELKKKIEYLRNWLVLV